MIWPWSRREQGALSAAQARRLAAWRALPPPHRKLFLDAAPLISVDVETAGLDPKRHPLLSVGAVRIAHGALQMSQAFHGVLHSEAPAPRSNVLVHGITPSLQAAGDDPADLLLDFLDYAGKAPMVAFHAPFDESAVQRAVRQHLGVPFRNPFLDLAYLLPALFPEAELPRAGLEAWMKRFGVTVTRRHSADADALAAGQLLLICRTRALSRGTWHLHRLAALCRAQRWSMGR